MFNSVLFAIFIMLGAVNMAHLGFYLVGANLYDIWQFRRVARAPKRKHHLKQPLVTVLIAAHNESSGIVRCLETVRKNSYRKLQILVIDDASTDNTRSLVWQYIQKYPNRNIHLLRKQKNGGKAGALNHALRRHAVGDLVMTLDADSVLHKNAIKNAVAYFENQNVVGVAANVRVMDSNSVLGLLQQFEHMIGYRSKKFYTVTNSEFIIGGVASTYRRDVLKKVRYYDTDTQTEDIGLSMKIVAQGNKTHRIVYAADVVAMTEGVQTFTALLRQRYRWKMGSLQNLFKNKQLAGKGSRDFSFMLTIYRIPMAFISELLLLTQSFVLGYVVYLSIAFHTPQLFIGAYMLLTAYVLWTIWHDEHSSIGRKLSLSTYAPVMYFIFYIMDAVQMVAIVRCLFNPRQVLLRRSISSTWISPERAGEQVQFT